MRDDRKIADASGFHEDRSILAGGVAQRLCGAGAPARELPRPTDAWLEHARKPRKQRWRAIPRTPARIDRELTANLWVVGQIEPDRSDLRMPSFSGTISQ